MFIEDTALDGGAEFAIVPFGQLGKALYSCVLDSPFFINPDQIIS